MPVNKDQVTEHQRAFHEFTSIAQSPSIAAGGRGLGIAANIMGIGQQAFSAYKSV